MCLVTTAVPASDGAHGDAEASVVSRRALPRDDVAAAIDLAVLTALDPAVSAVAIRDALTVLSSIDTADRVAVLAQTRAEVWRQLRARGLHADSAPEVRVDAEPLAALTPAERTALYLYARIGLATPEVARVMDVRVRSAKALRRRAHVAFVRSVTALALAMDLTPCPVRDGLAARGAGMLSRRDVDALTLHAAECRICVDWLRRADHHAVTGYRALPTPDAAAVDLVVADLVRVPDAEHRRIVARAGAVRRDGRPPREPRFDRDPRYWLNRAIVFAVLSVALVLVGVLALNR